MGLKTKIRTVILHPFALFFEKVMQVQQQVKTDKLKKEFRYCGTDFNVEGNWIFKNPQYIHIGENFNSLYNLRIEAWDAYQNQTFTPDIYIGNNVCMNTDVHIGCINKIHIGNNVLIASKVYISDHSHGEISLAALDLPPINRPLISKGAVIIEDNVWVGENVSILPGVTIGRNSIIGANSVVSKNIPQNVVAAGIPAKIIKVLS
jgi:acetyltransferase-like isoleucine patch superfamily enzyme